MLSKQVTLRDQLARDRILNDLDTNFLVEAGAGSGKTTGLVQRMLALVRTGKADVANIAAITFTRKAAAQLRERFQTQLEKAYRDEPDNPRLSRALQELDRCFLGTVHSFCSRLLRERSLEAGIDPAFKEVEGAEERQLQEQCWNEYLETCRLQGGSPLADLADLGISRPNDLKSLFTLLASTPDVEAVCESVPPPDFAAVRASLTHFLHSVEGYLPTRRPAKGWDGLQAVLRRAMRLYRVQDMDEPAHLVQVLEVLSRSARKTLNRWSDKDTANLAEAMKDGFVQQVAAPTLQAWREYRHAHLIEFVQPAVGTYDARRQKLGMMNYQDLLMKAAELLKDNPPVRQYFAERFTHLLVDEFQDTDPIQAEIVMLLAGENLAESDWRQCAPRPGALFVVGDPKQSIYRFRRADIAIYNYFKELLVYHGGEVLELTTNFRSVQPIADVLNPICQELLPKRAHTYQAAFAPMHTVLATPAEDYFFGVHRITLPKVKYNRKPEIAAIDARRIATFIAWATAGNIRLHVDGGRLAQPGDFLILTYTKQRLQLYAQELEAVGVPVSISGSDSLADAREIRELMTLLQAVADPDAQVMLIGAMRGMFFGVSDEALYQFKQAGGRFSFLGTQPDGVEEIAQLQPVLAALTELRELWYLTRRLPPAAAVEAILNRTGLVPYQASGELGESRAGNLLKLVELARGAGAAGFAAVVDYLQDLLAGEGIEEGRLNQGEAGAVRIMNVHKAKGLEAPVVFLADPAGLSQHEPMSHVHRDGNGAKGYFAVGIKTGVGRTEVIAEPRRWGTWQAEAKKFDDAEKTRLLYVAATRAECALVVSSYPEKEAGAWADLALALGDLPELAEPLVDPENRPEESVTEDEVRAASAARREVLEAISLPSLEHLSVTEYAKGASEHPPWRATDEGLSWGNAVHRLLELTARYPQEEPGGFAQSVLAAEGRPVEEEQRLLQVVEEFHRSDLWKRATAARERHVEAPLSGMEGGTLLSGVADLVFPEQDGWVIVDYKTDSLQEDEVAAFAGYYRPQLQTYARLWATATGEPVKEAVLWFTALSKAVIV